MQKFTKFLKILIYLVFGIAFLSFSSYHLNDENRIFIHDFLNKHYNDETPNENLKSYELKITNTGFCRYRKVFSNGKEEFFAVNLSRINKIDYYGTIKNGELLLKTLNDDVIVQTRRDKTGDIDTMATCLIIPLKNIEVEQLNELSHRLRKISLKD